MDRSLSVWLGEGRAAPNHRDNKDAVGDHGVECLRFELNSLDVWTAASIGHYSCVKSIVDNETSVCSYPRGSSSSSHPSTPIRNDLNARNKCGWTALMYASYIGHDNIVNLLISQDGVDVNVKSAPGVSREVTALILGGKTLVVSVMIE